jgi:hypothetical protein
LDQGVVTSHCKKGVILPAPYPYLEKKEETVDGSGFEAGSSATAGRLELDRLWLEGLPGTAGLISTGVVSSGLRARRWPSKMAVVQGRSFAIIDAQIFAAAAASLIGPATRRNRIPNPLLPSLITMIGRSAIKGPFDLDLRSPRQSARKPGMEFAPPRSTPNSVRWIEGLGTFAAESVSVSSSLGGADATISGIGAAVMTFGGCMGSSSFGAAGSGGAIIDFEAISEVGGAGVFAIAGGSGSARAMAAGGFSLALAGVAGFSADTAGVAATGARAGFCAGAGVSDVTATAAGAGDSGAEVDPADAVGEGAGPAETADAAVGEVAVCEGVPAEFCRVTVPVTDSNPCSRMARRE